MKNCVEKMTALWRDEEGATAIEYGLMAGGIAAVIAATVFALGGSMNAFFGAIDSKLIEAAKTKVDNS